MDRLKIINGKLVTPYRVVKGGSILIENGLISYVGEEGIDAGDCPIIDAEGNYVSPGFIDIHTHGGGGYDFMDGDVESYVGAAAMHARHGTTSMVPTTLACSNDELKASIEAFGQARSKNAAGSEFLGIHLEGPYFSMEQKGAQDPRYVRAPERAEYTEILGWTDDIIRWSAAPELNGALEFAAYVRSRGILPSIAHTDAIYEQVEKAFEYGFTHATHLYSAMSGVRRINARRYAGVIESAFLIDDMTVEIIADGVHLPPSLLKLVYKIKGASRTALVTDSMRGAGMPDGESLLGSKRNGQLVLIEDGVAKLPDRTAFAGSVATADRLVRTMVSQAGVPLADAVRMITLTPAEIIGVSGKKGSLSIGKDADIVIFDENVRILNTIIKGKVVYSDPVRSAV